MKAGQIHIGMSGWTYPDWRGSFYPKGLTQAKELHYASRQMNSIEINGTFYSLQKPASFEKWYSETPEDFRFSLKAPKYITHVRRLKDVREPLCNFLASGVFCLKEKLGPILWQFPPNLTLKDERFAEFMKLLPYDSKSALKLAKQHTDKVKDRNYLKVDGDYPIRHAFEFRHESFKNAEFLELMRKHNVAVVFAHSGEHYMEEVTADFIYARLHGLGKKYKKGYPDDVIIWFGDRVQKWITGAQPSDAETLLKAPPKTKRDAFIYFDTYEKDYAPFDAIHFMRHFHLKAAG